jgi:diguanylate cyclase (GGDEF)-like protein
MGNIHPPMVQPELSLLDGARVAEAVSDVVHTRQALELIATELQQRLGSPVAILVRHGGAWSPVVTSDVAAGGWHFPSEQLRFSPEARVVTVDGADGPVTAVQLSCDPDSDHDLAFAIHGDLTACAEALTQWSLILGYALRAARARDTAVRTERFLLRGYAMARRLSRVSDVDRVAQTVVTHAARLLDAGRVSLALYSNADACLMIAATYGYPATSVADVRISSGDWVVGHVYATGRPVVVDDATALAEPMHFARYNSCSFAAVPVMAGGETIGVLSVTDKRDDLPFANEDVVALRAVGALAGFALAAARIEREAARLAHAATIDSLTGLLNRTYLDGRLHQEIERARREQTSLALLIADIDDFKSINDRWGHQVGDAVLEAVGQVIRSAVRVFDVCARYGGDEFAIVMPNSDETSATACAERIRRLLDGYRSGGAEGARVTMSIGLAVFESGDAASDLIARADRAMYQVKARTKHGAIAEAPAPAQARPQLPRPPAANRAFQSPESHTNGGTAREVRSPVTELPYVLVADTRADRASFCRDAISGLQRGLLITHDGEQAVRAINQFGTPALLIVDLAMPAQQGFDVIDAVRRDDRRRAPIIAWASTRAMREYAASRLNGLNVHVIADTASPATLRAAIRRLLDPESAGMEPVRSEPDMLRKRVAALANRAQQLCGTPGVAIYIRASGEEKFRASFAWSSDDLMPHSPWHLPRAFEHITRTGESVVVRNVADGGDGIGSAAEGADDEIQGFAGVPIVSDRQVVGAICVFDVEPLSLDERTVESLRGLGRISFEERPGVPPPLPAPGFRDRASDHAGAVPAALASSRWINEIDWPPSLLERQGGEFAVARERARARREGLHLSVILFDLAAADGAEPAMDDETPETVTETLLRAIRQSDLPIRWSARELLVVLPGLADHQARSVAERVRAALYAGARHRMAISGGVAELKADEPFGEVVNRARQRVALARGRGHNRVL